MPCWVFFWCNVLFFYWVTVESPLLYLTTVKICLFKDYQSLSWRHSVCLTSVCWRTQTFVVMVTTGGLKSGLALRQGNKVSSRTGTLWMWICGVSASNRIIQFNLLCQSSSTTGRLRSCSSASFSQHWLRDIDHSVWAGWSRSDTVNFPTVGRLKDFLSLLIVLTKTDHVEKYH